MSLLKTGYKIILFFTLLASALTLFALPTFAISPWDLGYSNYKRVSPLGLEFYRQPITINLNFNDEDINIGDCESKGITPTYYGFEISGESSLGEPDFSFSNIPLNQRGINYTFSIPSSISYPTISDVFISEVSLSLKTDEEQEWDKICGTLQGFCVEGGYCSNQDSFTLLTLPTTTAGFIIPINLTGSIISQVTDQFSDTGTLAIMGLSGLPLLFYVVHKFLLVMPK